MCVVGAGVRVPTRRFVVNDTDALSSDFVVRSSILNLQVNAFGKSWLSGVVRYEVMGKKPRDIAHRRGSPS